MPQRRQFSRVVAAMAKNSTTATSNVYQLHFYVDKQLKFVAQTRILDFLKRLALSTAR